MTLPPGKSATIEAVTQDIIELVRAEAGPVDLTADSTLFGGGLDSLKVLSLIFKIEKRYDIVLDEEDGDDLNSVGDLAELVVRRIQERP
ncbi:MAG: acyl carrier protein [Mycobacterium sp.]|jgi:acyl carrier protein|nr:acyl carrier protein [Mycobacterium sp.]